VDDFLVSLEPGAFSADAVIVATPTSTHATLAQELVKKNLSVLVEKPLAVTGAEGRTILDACRQSTAAGGKGIVMVGHHRRHHSYVLAVKKAIDEGRLGRVLAVNGGKSTCSCERVEELAPLHCCL
jgi:predicted dehydrogenase